ncbi:MAG: 23S rRNA (pseudouridine(1915)-N(3))-methyltransferase RlmH [Tannerellaceae bacterium]|jgi:23S rRNA (pseudouridine1915-N3)-methyltransferase|nr:23S rRNA (pseudouridine(1915)-N(3))-methyltransferase RlmH [Tannerellaceae bacterium]
MKIILLVVGKTDHPLYTQAVEDYRKRVLRYLPFEIAVIPDLRNRRNLSESQQKEKEGELILKSLEADDYCVLLDEKGKEYSSENFAAYVEGKMHTVRKRLVFVVGGPYGFAEEVYAASADRVSLSRMTFSHQMIRLLFAEQLYRALTILHNEPYHHR